MIFIQELLYDGIIFRKNWNIGCDEMGFQKNGDGIRMKLDELKLGMEN